MSKETVSTIQNTPHSIERATIDRVVSEGGELFINLVVDVVKLVQAQGVALEQRDLLARTILADIAGALRPLARMLSCTDGAAEHLPEQMREILSEARGIYGREKCTGISAAWCPNCGDCKCPERGDFAGDMDSPDCPLHAINSTHGDDAEA